MKGRHFQSLAMLATMTLLASCIADDDAAELEDLEPTSDVAADLDPEAYAPGVVVELDPEAPDPEGSSGCNAAQLQTATNDCNEKHAYEQTDTNTFASSYSYYGCNITSCSYDAGRGRLYYRYVIKLLVHDWWFGLLDTSSATQNYAAFDYHLNIGDQLVLGGCQSGDSFSGDTYLRLLDGESEVASNDDSCGLGSQISFRAPHAGTYSAHLGCFSSGSCSGKFTGVVTPTDWTYCSAESSTCNMPGTKLVRFGHDTRWNYQVATDSVGCNNAQFGDPAYGEYKDCYYTELPTDHSWVQCAEEYQTCNYSGNVTIAYGDGTTWTYATGTAGSVYCDNSVFGDPAVGAMKYCYIKQM
ncbi:MAG: hypothetical protein HOW73_48330 [Polyangiaceae bacterium]|nr:hypothetical protein [Polyangiaceae bacterium]